MISFPSLFADTTSSGLVSLGTVDYLIIGIYFAFVLGIGFYLKHFADTGEEFFLAGREMTAWIAGLAFISANLGALELLGWAGNTYEYGIMAAHWYWIGAIPAMIFLGLVMMPFYYISKTHSVPGYLLLRFGPAARALSAVTFAFMTVLMSGINMFSMAKVMEVVLGWNFAPLFGTVLLGMLWKRATGYGGFLGLLAGVLSSIGMFTWVELDHDTAIQYVALSANASGMAENMYSALWSGLICVAVTVIVSLPTPARPESELVGLVKACTDIPPEGDYPLIHRPLFWSIVGVVCLILNIIFW